MQSKSRRSSGGTMSTSAIRTVHPSGKTLKHGCWRAIGETGADSRAGGRGRNRRSRRLVRSATFRAGCRICPCRRQDPRGNSAKPFRISSHMGAISARGASTIPIQFDLCGIPSTDERCILLPRPQESESLARANLTTAIFRNPSMTSLDILPVLKAQMPQLRGRLLANQPLAELTWFRVGGPAQVLFIPEDEQDLAYFLIHLPPD